MNYDGKITTTDVALIERYLLGKIDFTEDQINRADLNKDKKITSSDTALIIRYILGQSN